MSKEYGDYEQVNGGVVNDLTEEIKTLKADLLNATLDIKESRRIFCDWYNNGRMIPIEVTSYLNRTKFNFAEPLVKEMLKTVLSEANGYLNEYVEILDSPEFADHEKVERIKEMVVELGKLGE